MEKNVFEDKTNLYLSSFGEVTWFQSFNEKQESLEDRKIIEQELSRQIIEGLKATGALVLHNAEESLNQLAILLDLLNPAKGLQLKTSVPAFEYQ